ncbi:MAG: ISNCY family transposase [Desulfobulbaceae bacterium]|nr:ISNCY family transposase [Desulfobulbaceae bacterium]
MRQRFEQQISLGILPIIEVEIDMKSRHQLSPVLLALQYIFVTRELSEEAFGKLEDSILKGKQKTGRNGMSLWEILVLGVVRLNLDIDYDFLLDMANNHQTLRGILGVGQSDYKPGKKYHLQTLKDNIGLLKAETIKEINDLVVKAGHSLIKKKEEAKKLILQVKADSYVVETNIHFPTDINLLWDSGRKCLDMIKKLMEEGVCQEGWRERKDWFKKLRNNYRNTAEIHRKKGANYKERLLVATAKYLGVARGVSEKVRQTILDGATLVAGNESSIKIFAIIQVLQHYHQMLDKHIDLVDRRILKGEKIPHEEKLFSIFETHTEWIRKGKLYPAVELGKNVLIATDQYQFILHHHVMDKQVDVQVALPAAKEIASQFGACDYELDSISFDRNFFSGPLKKELSKLFKKVIMPKPGKKSIKQAEEESSKLFVKLRHAHSTVESNINQLEHSGVNRCPDRGTRGFKRYVALGVLSYNLQHLGKLLQEQNHQRDQPQKCRSKRAA